MEGSIKITANEILQIPHKTCHALKNLLISLVLLGYRASGLIQTNTRKDIQEKTCEVTQDWKLYSGKQETCARTEEMEMDMLWGQYSQLTEATVMGLFNPSCTRAGYCHYLHTAELIPMFSKIYWISERIPEKTHNKKPSLRSVLSLTYLTFLEELIEWQGQKAV